MSPPVFQYTPWNVPTLFCTAGYTEYITFEWVDGPATVGSVALGFYSSMWAYGGWNNLNMIVEELEDPHK